jgi:hypothetical protein
MAASLFAEPDLLAAHRASLQERGAGPHHVNDLLAAYLAAEQEFGRVHPDADPQVAAALLLGACLQHAFFGAFADRPVGRTATGQVAATLVKTLAGGLVPPEPRPARPGGEPALAG